MQSGSQHFILIEFDLGFIKERPSHEDLDDIEEKQELELPSQGWSEHISRNHRETASLVSDEQISINEDFLSRGQ